MYDSDLTKRGQIEKQNRAGEVLKEQRHGHVSRVQGGNMQPMARHRSDDVGFGGAWLPPTQLPQPRQLSRITHPILRQPVILSRDPFNQSPNCGTHISPAPTWTSPTSCTLLRSQSSTKLALYQAAASDCAIGIEDR